MQPTHRAYALHEHIRTELTPVKSTPARAGCFDCILFSMSFIACSRIPAWFCGESAHGWRPAAGWSSSRPCSGKGPASSTLVKPRLKYVTDVDFGRAIVRTGLPSLLRSEGLQSPTTGSSRGSGLEGSAA